MVKAFHALLMRVRPAQLADMLKVLFNVQRSVIATSDGHRFLVDPVSVFGTQVVSRGIYEPDMTRLLEHVLRPGDDFVDLGGNEGYFSVVAASRVNGGSVHCIEPQSRLQELLNRNFSLNGSNVQVHRCAISDQNGTVRLFLRPSTNAGASGLIRHWRVGGRSEDVPSTTLDAFFLQNRLRNVRLVKVDCEGAEPLVMAGAKRVLERQQVEMWAIEYHPRVCGYEGCEYVHATLANAGYVLSRYERLFVYHLPSLGNDLNGVGMVAVSQELPRYFRRFRPAVTKGVREAS